MARHYIYVYQATLPLYGAANRPQRSAEKFLRNLPLPIRFFRLPFHGMDEHFPFASFWDRRASRFRCGNTCLGGNADASDHQTSTCLLFIPCNRMGFVAFILGRSGRIRTSIPWRWAGDGPSNPAPSAYDNRQHVSGL